MKVEQCCYCRKWVSHKPLLGTLHFCLSPDEIAQIERGRQMVQFQKQFIARQEGLGQEFERPLFDNLFDLYSR